MNKVKSIQTKKLIEIIQEPEAVQISWLQHATEGLPDN
jgi:hypothetical protein